MKITVSEPSGEMDGFLVYIPREVTSIIAGQLTYLLSRRLYATTEDHIRGYNAVSCVLGGFVSCSARILLEKVDRVYRLIDADNNGTVYSVVSTEPLVIEPAIPDVPSSTPVLPGVKAQLEDARVKLQEVIDKMGEG